MGTPTKSYTNKPLDVALTEISDALDTLTAAVDALAARVSTLEGAS